MSCYSAFARVYDQLTSNINYKNRADYFCSLLEKYTKHKGICLDLACGTGSLSIELSSRGFDVIGVDLSPEMLSIANQKKIKHKMDITFLCQNMSELDLYGTIDVCFCTLDSINHITKLSDLQKAFDKVSLFLNTNGYFIFDINTEYKHNEVLGNNSFVFETDDTFLVWQNTLQKNNVKITLDIFERNDFGYIRTTEEFSERAYSLKQIKTCLKKAGLELVDVFDEDSFNQPNEKSQRLIVVSKK